MNGIQLIRTTAAIGSIALLSAGCGNIIEKASEKAVEEAVERAVESDTGEDVEVDFNDDGISIESDEGEFTLSADEDGVQIDGTDDEGNDFSLDADEDGIEIDSEDGSGSLDIDDDGSFTVTDENGEVVTGNVDADDESFDFTVEGEDGDAVFSQSEGIPNEWPSDVPQPDGLSDVVGTYFAEGDTMSIVITGSTSGDAMDLFDDYVSELEDAGFEEVSKFTQGDSASASFSRGDEGVNVSVQPQGDTTQFVVGLS